MLKDKHKIFAKEYIIEFNGSKAAIKAGYAKSRADITASELLKREDIQLYIKSLIKKRSEKLDITAEMVIKELAKIGFYNVKDFVNGGNNVLELKNIESEKTAAVSSVKTTMNEHTGNITTEIKFHDKVSALEKLGKHLGIFEKDNEQAKQIPVTVPAINIYNNAPPLANKESEV